MARKSLVLLKHIVRLLSENAAYRNASLKISKYSMALDLQVFPLQIDQVVIQQPDVTGERPKERPIAKT